MSPLIVAERERESNGGVRRYPLGSPIQGGKEAGREGGRWQEAERWSEDWAHYPLAVDSSSQCLVIR